MPGISSSAAYYVMSGKKSSLGFWLAERGYDVWIANYRGTTYSRKHKKWNPDKEKKLYWDFR